MDALDFADLACFNDVLPDDLACQIQLLLQSTCLYFFRPISFHTKRSWEFEVGLQSRSLSINSPWYRFESGRAGGAWHVCRIFQLVRCHALCLSTCFESRTQAWISKGSMSWLTGPNSFWAETAKYALEHTCLESCSDHRLLTQPDLAHVDVLITNCCGLHNCLGNNVLAFICHIKVGPSPWPACTAESTNNVLILRWWAGVVSDSFFYIFLYFYIFVYISSIYFFAVSFQEGFISFGFVAPPGINGANFPFGKKLRKDVR